MMPAKELCYLFRVILRIYCFDGCVQNIVNCIYHVRSCCYVFHPAFRSFHFVRPQNAVKTSGALFMAKYVCQCLYQSDYITQICRFPSLSICFSSSSHLEMVCRLTPSFSATSSCDRPLFLRALNKLFPKLMSAASLGSVCLSGLCLFGDRKSLQRGCL